MRYVYRNINSPNSARLNGNGKIVQLMLTSVSETDSVINISLVGESVEFFILKNTILVSGTSLDVFDKEYNYDPSYQFVIKVISGSVDMLLTVN